MGSADRSKIDGIVVVPEKGARSCVECRATTTPMWRSGPTGPRVDSTIIESRHSETSMLFEDLFSEVSSYSDGQMFEVDLTMQELLSLCNACGIRYRKKRRQELGLDHKQQKQQNNGEAKTEVKDSSSNSSSSGSSNLQVVQKRRLLMGVEEAALLLMTLSSSPTSTLLHG